MTRCWLNDYKLTGGKFNTARISWTRDRRVRRYKYTINSLRSTMTCWINSRPIKILLLTLVTRKNNTVNNISHSPREKSNNMTIYLLDLTISIWHKSILKYLITSTHLMNTPLWLMKMAEGRYLKCPMLTRSCLNLSTLIYGVSLRTMKLVSS